MQTIGNSVTALSRRRVSDRVHAIGWPVIGQVIGEPVPKQLPAPRVQLFGTRV